MPTPIKETKKYKPISFSGDTPFLAIKNQERITSNNGSRLGRSHQSNFECQ